MKTTRLAMVLMLFGFVLALTLGSANAGLAADQYTINCISAFAKSTHVTQFFMKDFMDEVQKAADQKYPGELKMVFKGGPELVATNEQIVALQKGMVDLMYSAPGFYVSKMPELDALNVTTMKPWEEKATGLYDYLDKLHNEKTNTHFLVRNGIGLGFHICLNKPIKTLDDLKGLNLRGNPTTVQIVKALGANPVQMAPGDVYTALERGVVQGHITPAFMLRTLGIDTVTKYIIFPSFFDTTNVLLMNLDKWKKLPKHLQELITEVADVHARHFVAYNQDLEKQELAYFKSEGIQFIDLPKAEADKLIKIANETMLKVASDKAPEETKKILEYLQKKP